MVSSIFVVINTLLKSSTFHIWYYNANDIPLVLRKHNVICGVLHHPGDIGEYPMFRKANGDDIPEDETDNDPVLAKEFGKTSST